MDITLNSKILVVDDSLLVLKVVEKMLEGRYNVTAVSSAKKALEFLDNEVPDLILLDLEMPQMNGYELLAVLKGTPKHREIPVIILTGVDDRVKEEKALIMGAVDYITKPISSGVLTKRIQMNLELKEYQKNLEQIVNTKTRQLLKTQDLVLDILANVTTYRDNDTGAHIIRTTHYSSVIANRLLELQHPEYPMEKSYAEHIMKCAKLHDIGKVAISDNILLKSARLTPSEFETIKKHTTYGAQMIEGAINSLGADASFLLTAREIILYHHEWWNGEGYPYRLKGAQIPISARVMAIADVYDALISVRPYKKSLTHEAAVKIIKAEAGTHFDSTLLKIVDELFPRFKEIAETFKD